MENQHEWLKKEIAKGFMLLSALNLKGRPASKDGGRPSMVRPSAQTKMAA